MDVENCVRELLNSELVQADGARRAVPGGPAVRPDVARVLDDFLSDKQSDSLEDRSPSVQRFREMIGGTRR